MTKLRPSGGYQDAAGFQMATIICDATYWFCDKPIGGLTISGP